MISSERMKEAQLAAAAAMNRGDGKGSGTGFLVAQLLSDQDTGIINMLFTGVGKANAVDVSSSSATFVLARPSRVLIHATVNFANNAGNTDYAYVYVDIDGAQASNSALSGTAFQPYTATIVTVPLRAKGSHTVKLRAYVGAAANTGIIYEAETFVFLLGA